MRFITAWLVILFVSVASGASTSPEEKSSVKIEETTEVIVTSSIPEKSTTSNDILKTTETGKITDNDRIDLATNKDVNVEELFLIEKAIGEEEKLIQEQNQKKTYPNNAENKHNATDVDNSPEIPNESKINKDYIDIRRLGKNNKSVKVSEENSNPAIQYDDSKEEVTDSQLKYGERARKFRPRIPDSAPLLQLTQGGYERPYKRARFRGSYSPRPDSSEQSENLQQPDKTSSNKKMDTKRIVPQVTYVPSSQPSFIFAQGPLMNPSFDAPGRNMLAMNQILSPSAENGFLNSPPTEFAGYPIAAFQPQFAPNSDAGSIPNFSRDPSNAGMYQTLSNAPFQTPGMLFQNSPQIQPQPVLIDAGRNAQTRFAQNPVPVYSGYETMQDSPNPNYPSFFQNSAINTPFQVPPNFFSNTPNAVNSFNNPSANFLSQISQYPPNFDNGVLSQLYQYPDARMGAHNNQLSPNNQQLNPTVSQDENKGRTMVQNTDKPVNRDDSEPAQFGTGLQTKNIANVYMRYPTVEAGYAIEEILPLQNNSNESKEDSKQSKEQTNTPATNPYRNALNSVRSYQRINNSFEFPPELFRSVPVDFGYQRPPDGIFSRYPNRNRGTPNYPSPNFESRLPFNTINSQPGNFLVLSNQQNVQQESNETPSCAKKNNASFCFEDNDYPKNDILYALSNSFLIDRLLGPEPALNSFNFVERSGIDTGKNEENYACDVATKYGMPLRAKNLAGMWKVIVNLQERYSQPLRMEVCKNIGSSCSYADSRIKTTCVQKFSLHRLLTWSPNRGIYSDVFKIPVACSCQIIQKAEN